MYKFLLMDNRMLARHEGGGRMHNKKRHSKKKEKWKVVFKKRKNAKLIQVLHAWSWFEEVMS